MKAVLMNSADKVEDTSGTGQFLGMERTVLKQNGVDGWFDSDAAFDPLIPLDNEMGVGHLNAKRALQQFAPGEHDFDAGDVPLIGWDYASTSGIPFNFNRYVFEQELTAGDWISITLAWDREVELTVDDGAYNPGDTFVEFTEPDADDVINDLDLYLLPKGATDAGQAVWSSISALGTVEHMFIDILDTGEYEFWVLQNDTDVGAQDYTVAWWYGLAPPIGPPDVTGDFDGDGDVDGRDFLAWQRNPSVGNLADWQNNYGMGTLAGLGDEPARFAVPEPGCLLLLLPIAFLLRRRNAAC